MMTLADCGTTNAPILGGAGSVMYAQPPHNGLPPWGIVGGPVRHPQYNPGNNVRSSTTTWLGDSGLGIEVIKYKKHSTPER